MEHINLSTPEQLRQLNKSIKSQSNTFHYILKSFYYVLFTILFWGSFVAGVYYFTASIKRPPEPQTQTVKVKFEDNKYAWSMMTDLQKRIVCDGVFSEKVTQRAFYEAMERATCRGEYISVNQMLEYLERTTPHRW